MIKCFVFLIVVLALAGCVSDIDNGRSKDSSKPSCSWIMPGGFADMTRGEYENWLREEMPSQAIGDSDCELTDEQIQGLLESLEEDQVRQGRWKRHFDLHDRMIEIRTEYRTITADGIVDTLETAHVCNVLDTWRLQLTEILNFLVDYRRVEPQLVENTPSLRDLESESAKMLGWLKSVDPTCG